MSSILQKGDKLAMKVIIWGGCLVTLFFWAPLNDPFNAPKSWLLSISAFWLVGWILFQIKDQVKIQTLTLATISAGFYLLAMAIAYIATDNKYTGLFGEYQRRNGFLTYFCFIIFFLASSYIFRLSNIHQLELALAITGFFTAIYGLIQHYKHDFVHWNNPYNSVLSTLGNPDFAAAVMAIFLVVCFGITIQAKYSVLLRIFAGFNSILLFITIEFSQVRQGLVASGIGVGIVLIIWLHQRNKYISYGLGGLSISIAFFAINGMLNKGPLIKYFYKESVTYRGDYWRAGWKMFINHPLFGVGLDRYGANFRQYRDATQAMRRGPELVANAAHNVPLQLASTGGAFVLIAYITFTLFILWRGMVALRKTKGSQQITVAVIFAAWITYQVQSLISIDNIAIAIWGYILGGAVVGLSILGPRESVRENRELILQPAVSGFLVLFFLAISALFLGSESSVNSLNKLPAPQTQNELASYLRANQKPLTYILKEPSFELINARNLAQTGNIREAIVKLKALIAHDHLYFSALDLLARIYEYQKNWIGAAEMRKTIETIDPYNQINLLSLGEDYKNAGESVSAKALIPVINSFASHTPEALQAVKDFG